MAGLTNAERLHAFATGIGNGVVAVLLARHPELGDISRGAFVISALATDIATFRKLGGRLRERDQAQPEVHQEKPEQVERVVPGTADLGSRPRRGSRVRTRR